MFFFPLLINCRTNNKRVLLQYQEYERRDCETNCTRDYLYNRQACLRRFVCVHSWCMYVCMYLGDVGISALRQWEETLQMWKATWPVVNEKTKNKTHTKKIHAVKSVWPGSRRNQPPNSTGSPTSLSERMSRQQNLPKKNAGSTGTSRTLDGLRHTGEDETRFDCFAAVRSRDTGDWMSWWLDDILGHNNRIWPERDVTRRLLRRGTINIHVTVSGCGWQIIFVALFNAQVEVNRDARRTTKELKAQREVNFWRTQLKK